MPKCRDCGRSRWARQLDGMGRCDDCSAKARKKRQAARNMEIRRKNYTACRNGTAAPEYQRIYDAFIAEYPDALIDNISVHPGENRIVVYLQGDVAYDVTFNPLLNTVDVVKQGSREDGESKPHQQKGKETARLTEKQLAEIYDGPEKTGGKIFVAILTLLYNIFLLLFSYAGGIVGIFSAIVALTGGIAKSKTVIVFGALLLILPLVIAFPYSFINLIFLILLL